MTENSKIDLTKYHSYCIKGMAILLLLFHHLFYEGDRLYENGIIIPCYDKFWVIDCFARICVWIFCFVSCYGLTKKYNQLKNELWKYIFSSWISLMLRWWIILIVIISITHLFVGNVLDLYQRNWILFFLDFFEWNDFFEKTVVFGNWYLCFTQVIIILIPFFDWLSKKFGIYSIALLYISMQYMSNGIFSTGGGEYIIYFPTALFAVWCAQGNNINLFLKVSNNKSKKMIDGFFLVTVVFLSLWIKWEYDYKYLGSLCAIVATLSIILIVVNYMTKLHTILAFLGKRSMAMFLIHSYLYIYFPKMIFWSKNAVLSYITLVGCSLLFGIFIEVVKKLIKYDQLIMWIKDKVYKFMIVFS